MNFTSLDGILRILHVAAGGVALLAGLLAILSLKGKKLHLLSGKIYFWAMAAIFFTAIPIAIPKQNIFLLCISVFSFYMAFSGYRFTRLKRITAPPRFDQAVAVLAAAAGLGMIGWAGWILMQQFSPMAVILAVFGAFSAGMALQDLRRFASRENVKGRYIIGHLIRMEGSYIAAITAFLVNNFTHLPPLVIWLTPTLLGTIGITLSARHYRKKYKVA